MSIVITLPWPPSLSHYFVPMRMGRSVRIHKSARAKRYRQAVADAVLSFAVGKGRLSFAPLTDRLSVSIDLHAPTRRVYDIDNMSKGILDGLTFAGVWADDSLIDRLLSERGPVITGGKVIVTIERIKELQKELFKDGR